MPDQSGLDSRYFIDVHVYNCPFCNRRNVSYTVTGSFHFNWTDAKVAHAYLILCTSCSKTSLHLSFHRINLVSVGSLRSGEHRFRFFDEVGDIDAKMFFSVPTSFFVTDDRIPAVIRELLTESEGCLKMNYLTGASACARKAIYELLVREKASGDDYDRRIKSLKNKHPEIDPTLFDVLSHLQQMTSDKVHEESWPKWDSAHLKLIIETLRAVLHEIYVVPEERKRRTIEIERLRADLARGNKEGSTGIVRNEVENAEKQHADPGQMVDSRTDED